MYEMYPNAWNDESAPVADSSPAPRRRQRVEHDVTPPAARRARDEAGNRDHHDAA